MARWEVGDGKVVIIRRGDITAATTEAVVNAANSRLVPGGGVCGAIHKAGGPAIAKECRAYVAEHGPVTTGEAAITTGGRLSARYVIHTVGPVWHGGRHHEAELLGAAYRSAMEVADTAGLGSVAFPSISTGIFGYPVELAAPVALGAVRSALVSAVNVSEVEIVLFDDAACVAWTNALEDVRGEV